MKPLFLSGVGVWLAWAMVIQGAEPMLRVLKPSSPATALLRNGGFEEVRDGQAVGWNRAPQGCRFVAGEGRDRSGALVCENASGQGWFGASQTLTLNRTTPVPLVVRGWSKAEKVSGSTDSGYSLYVDIVYADGTPLWGQTGNFRCGTHDWEQRQFMILPDKPVKTMTLHCLFRGHAGKVWFDDVSVEELQTDAQTHLFQGVPVVWTHLRPEPIPGVDLDKEFVHLASHSLFLARDVAAGSDFFAFTNWACDALGLKLQAGLIYQSNHWQIKGQLIDITGKDRAVTLVFGLPLEAIGWRWGDDIRRSRLIESSGDYINQVSVRCGATGTQSLYPIAPIWDQRRGIALGLDMTYPAVYRLGYHAGLNLLYIAYDFGLVKDTRQAPSSAAFRFVLYRFDPAWGFRAAWQQYMKLFPDYFVVRAKEQGLWMPFTDVSTVQGWEDFGFKFHEGNNNVPWDDAHGILSFRYTEPMTWWMPMAKDRPRTLAEALRVRDELAARGNPTQRRMAEVSRLAVMHDEAGQPCVLFRNEPWCNGAVWSLNPNPWLAPSGPKPEPSALASTQAQATSSGPKTDSQNGVPLNAATVHWNPGLKDRLYGPGAKGQLDGEYLDSLEGYVTADLNFRREHFRYSTVPLTFSTDTHQPALFKGLAVFEFTKWICDDVHRLGKLTFANGVPYRFTYLCPWLDVLGTETDWLRGGKYQPMSDATMSLWRALAGAKPYLLLMNTDYDRFTPDLVEKYFQRALFYGMWPGFFSHNASENPYWRNPNWYNRDRPLFRKYIPIIKQVAEAGWHPITEAVCDNGKIYVERFGPDAAGRLYFTLFNDTPQPQQGTLLLRPEAGPAAQPAAVTVTELVCGQTPPRVGAGWQVSLQPQQVAVLRIGP